MFLVPALQGMISVVILGLTSFFLGKSKQYVKRIVYLFLEKKKILLEFLLSSGLKLTSLWTTQPRALIDFCTVVCFTLSIKTIVSPLPSLSFPDSSSVELSGSDFLLRNFFLDTRGLTAGEGGKERLPVLSSLWPEFSFHALALVWWCSWRLLFRRVVKGEVGLSSESWWRGSM